MSSSQSLARPRRCPNKDCPHRPPSIDLYDVIRCGGNILRTNTEEMLRSRRWLADLGKVTVEALVRHMIVNGARLKDTDFVLGGWNYYLDQLIYDRDAYRGYRSPSPVYRDVLEEMWAESCERARRLAMAQKRKRALERAMAAYVLYIGDPKGDTLSVESLSYAYREILVQEAERPDGFLEELNETLRYSVPISLYWGPSSSAVRSRSGSPAHSRSRSRVRGRSRSPRESLRATRPGENSFLPLCLIVHCRCSLSSLHPSLSAVHNRLVGY